jgi:hypothetical protein
MRIKEKTMMGSLARSGLAMIFGITEKTLLAEIWVCYGFGL